MPDTFTHIALPAIFSRFFKRPIIAPMVLIGTILPDFLRELTKLVVPSSLFPAAYVFHSLIGIICMSLLLSSLFMPVLRVRVFVNLMIGQSIHLGFDLFQYYLNGGQLYLLLPYWKAYQIGIYSDSYWIYLFIVSFIIFSIYSLVNIRRKKKTTNFTN